MKHLLSVHWVLAVAIWYFGNGALHDISVISKHTGGYNRELLRLLTDGHLLILSGVISYMCYLMMLSRIQCGGLIGIVIGVAMLVYCAMISPFLPAIGTIVMSIMLIIVSIQSMRDSPNIYNIMQEHK